MSRWFFGLLGMSIVLTACGGKVVDPATGDPEADERPPAESTAGAGAGQGEGTQDAGSESGSGSGSGWACDIPSNGCDYCGNVTCPPGSLLDSACRCLDSSYGYVAPISQTCDFCCGKTCEPGQFLDFECDCY